MVCRLEELEGLDSGMNIAGWVMDGCDDRVRPFEHR